MKRIAHAGTTPEIAVRKEARDLGLHFRTNSTRLPGSPDLSNSTRRWALFVHGCFWHAHEGCRLATRPKINARFWRQKLLSNQARDKRTTRALRDAGFRVVVIWECETRDLQKLRLKLRRFAAALGGRPQRRSVPART